jgi:hypothetical protein
MTTGMKTSCKHKRELYLTSRNSHDPKLKLYYKLYCKVLSNVILEAKRNNYNSQILRFSNKIKTTWEIVKVESGKRINKNNNTNMQEINVDGDSTDDPQVVAGVFNEYFLSVAEKPLPQDNNINNNDNAGISDIKDKHSSTINSDPSYYLAHAPFDP